jgi:hypothetical protein
MEGALELLRDEIRLIEGPGATAGAALGMGDGAGAGAGSGASSPSRRLALALGSPELAALTRPGAGALDGLTRGDMARYATGAISLTLCKQIV